MSTAQPASSATGAQASGPPLAAAARIQYEVQEGEALIAIAETFGTSRREILAANPGMADQRPYTQPGDVIIVPVSAEMSRADVEAVPGFIGYVE
jgi:LysM repeat protein